MLGEMWALKQRSEKPAQSSTKVWGERSVGGVANVESPVQELTLCYVKK
jgi:hypothetical protein